jgi:ABC-type branched-subunit amino acid transport system substrate-binding protein
MLLLWALAAVFVFGLAVPAFAQQGKPLKLALIEDKTGPLEAYVKQLVTGFRSGLEYTTKGSDTVAGRKIAIVEKNSQFEPDLGRTLLEQTCGDDNADLAIGGTSSGVALAMLPVAQDNAFGCDGIAAFKEALALTGAKLIAVTRPVVHFDGVFFPAGIVGSLRRPHR